MKSINSDVIQHYDLLIEENNDPVHDPKPLKDYMDKWDGQAFIDKMDLDKDKSVLEIGVGTGRLAVKTVILCKDLFRPKQRVSAMPTTLKRIIFSSRS